MNLLVDFRVAMYVDLTDGAWCGGANHMTSGYNECASWRNIALIESTTIAQNLT